MEAVIAGGTAMYAEEATDPNDGRDDKFFCGMVIASSLDRDGSAIVFVLPFGSFRPGWTYADYLRVARQPQRRFIR